MRNASLEIVFVSWVCCALASAVIAKNTTQPAAQRPRIPVNPSKVYSKVPPIRPLDLRALVRRHNVTLSTPDPLTPLSVGNSEFAFTADITGLQTYPEYLTDIIPPQTPDDPRGYRVLGPKPFAQRFIESFGKDPLLCNIQTRLTTICVHNKLTNTNSYTIKLKVIEAVIECKEKSKVTDENKASSSQ